MNLVQVTNESIVIGQPLPFSLRDETGILLARKGYVIGSRADLESMRGRGLGFYVDVSESEKHQKAFVGKLLELVRDDRPLGKIAQAVGRVADAVVIGSRIIQLLENQPHERVVAVAIDFLRGVRKALDA